ncbi:MAG: GNAT family N-acetyltransferase [bacterium]
MNQQLIKDQQSRNPMTLSELEERMKRWLQGDWCAIIIQQENNPIGYLLYREETDDYFPEKKIIYIKQFFINTEKRNLGIGKSVFKKLQHEIFKNTEFMIDVLSINEEATNFWKSIGFAPYSLCMKLTNHS